MATDKRDSRPSDMIPTDYMPKYCHIFQTFQGQSPWLAWLWISCQRGYIVPAWPAFNCCNYPTSFVSMHVTICSSARSEYGLTIGGHPHYMRHCPTTALSAYLAMPVRWRLALRLRFHPKCG